MMQQYFEERRHYCDRLSWYCADGILCRLLRCAQTENQDITPSPPSVYARFGRVPPGYLFPDRRVCVRCVAGGVVDGRHRRHLGTSELELGDGHSPDRRSVRAPRLPAVSASSAVVVVYHRGVDHRVRRLCVGHAIAGAPLFPGNRRLVVRVCPVFVAEPGRGDTGGNDLPDQPDGAAGFVEHGFRRWPPVAAGKCRRGHCLSVH